MNQQDKIIEQHFEQQSEELQTQIFSDSDGAKNTANTLMDFMISYSNSKEMPINTWLDHQFAKYPTIWESESERQNTVKEIIESVTNFNDAKSELYNDYIHKGRSQGAFLADKIEQSAQKNNVDASLIASQVYAGMEHANLQSLQYVTTQSGQISLNPNLDGFIAEHHHVNSFNADAIAQGSEFRAKVLEPQSGEAFGKNSVDIAICDRNGKIVAKYQAKYGKDAQATKNLFDKGDYRGQQKLVPKGQGKDIPNSKEVIEFKGIKSKPLSKEEAKAEQERIQAQNEQRMFEWTNGNKLNVAKNVGKMALIQAGIAVAFQASRIIGRRISNWIQGKENQSVQADLKEFFQSSIESVKDVGLKVIISGAITVCAKSGWIPILKNTPAGKIATIVCVGLENAKILYKVAKGEMTASQGLDAMGNVTTSAIGGFAGGLVGAKLGASIGTVFGPVGTAVGGLIGGLVGGIAGSEIGQAVYQGAKSLAKTAGNILEQCQKLAPPIVAGMQSMVSTASSVVSSVASSVSSAVSSIASSVGSFLGFGK